MKIFILVILIGLTISTFGQDYNKYLIKPKKAGGSMYYYTNEKILGKWYYTQLLSLDLDRHPELPQIVHVNLDDIDMALAGIDGPVPDNMIFNSFYPKRLGIGVINTYGKFFIPPFYTQVQRLSYRYVMGEYDRYFLLGRKIKNGNWLAITFDKDNEAESKFSPLPEMKDYTLLTKNTIIYKDKNNKYGLMDFLGNIRLEADYDTCYANFSYFWFPKNSTTLINTGQSQTQLPASLEYAFNKMSVAYNLNLESRGKINQEIIIYLMQNKESMVLFSDNYITKPIKNATLTKHDFKGKNFFLLQGKNGEFDIIDFDGTAIDDHLKYAYYETIHRDTSGIEREWAFDPEKDYSKPYRLVNYDSIKLAENKKIEAEKAAAEALESQKNKELREQRLLLENDPTHYSPVVSGSYHITEFTKDGAKLNQTGYSYETSMHATWFEKNKVSLLINFKGKYYTTDAEFLTFKISLTVGIQKGVIGNSFNVGQGNVDGYVLSADYDNMSEESDFSRISGTYNPLTGELYIAAERKNGGSITIRGVKKAE